MRQLSRRTALTVLASGLVASCSAGEGRPEPAPPTGGDPGPAPSGAGPSGSGTPSSTGSPTPSPTAGRPALTARQRAGQRVVHSYSGTEVPAELLGLVAEGLVGGVILFGENVASLAQITAAVGQLQEANRASPVGAPLLVMADQEGGQVRRLPGRPYQSAKQIGAAADPAADAALAGQEAGELLRGAGLNVNLAPVLDVYRTPGDFADQAQRSYGDDPRTVAVCGREFVTAQQRQGVAATAKHFPGLGPAATEENTDERPVTLGTPLAELRRIDQEPYHDAIAAGVRLVMLSWAVYPQLDPARPAGLSTTVVGEELRGRVGFRGVTVSDSLTAKAVEPYGTPARVAVLGAAAGLDLLLECSGTVTGGQAAVEALAAALEGGELGSAAFDAACDRVLELRRGLA
ncbi:beta-N-acetylhexosaminidase [Kitasatospora sp. MMS16-BH015]|uniref:glycoside hydrolase family 3 N-terminal domain-containing protein n=1 Tax=Kitasatospora sp. MMS16-BH015 TaxID=2018025 RepID=UPI000CA10017|nr:glycoside hydrolase family 3 N-terminal domain-containing protein [Kitasatospora sp. MMS16-BH015]AUG76784.1 beta-N-acetylhexosaminidase [Kitasatospora sp. MMS16-BH015]